MVWYGSNGMSTACADRIERFSARLELLLNA